MTPGGDRAGSPPGPVPALWGFCPACERWRHSGGWGQPPRCPACGAAPDPMERWVAGTGRIEIVLELPPGADLPMLG